MSLTTALSPCRAQFVRFLREMSGPYRYSQSKYRRLIHDKWADVKRLARNESVQVAPTYVEIHLSEPCTLNCKYCRDELRHVPKNEAMLDREQALNLIDSIAALSPHAFIRFSGVIGEPLLPKWVEEVFARVQSHQGLRWGLTTNGNLLHRGRIMQLVLAAEYVHVSIDAGTDTTYQDLKKGRPGQFDQVLSNIKTLSELRRGHGSPVQLVASLLLQSENFREIPVLSKRLKQIGTDVFEIKMQHYDPRRRMTSVEIEEAYRLVADTQRRDGRDTYRVVPVQDAEAAKAKAQPTVSPIAFRRCYANLLGLNGTVDPRGNVQTCCQYHEKTLAIQGHLRDGFEAVWSGEQRLAVLQNDPRQFCASCSPSDEFVNRFVEFVRTAAEQDAEFLDWAEQKIASEVFDSDGDEQ